MNLALGVGVNTTLFAFVASVLWPRIDAPHPERLVHFGGSGSAAGDPSELLTSGPDFLDYRAENEVFSAFCASSTALSLLTRSDGITFRAIPEVVCGDYFELFGVRPAGGRLLTSVDEPSVVVLGHDFWQQTFQGDPGVLGTTVTVFHSGIADAYHRRRLATVVGIRRRHCGRTSSRGEVPASRQVSQSSGF